MTIKYLLRKVCFEKCSILKCKYKEIIIKISISKRYNLKCDDQNDLAFTLMKLIEFFSKIKMYFKYMQIDDVVDVKLRKLPQG